MKIELTNIGMIQNASVKLDGLTVIAGENDTGKSTVGKVVFCIIKAISRYEEDFQESKINKIEEKLDRLFFIIRKNINTEEEYKELKYILSIEYYLQNIDNNDSYLKNINSVIISFFKNIKNSFDENFIKSIIKELELIIQTPEDKNKAIQSALTKVFRSEFDSNIVSFDKEFGYIKLIENNLILLDLKIKNNSMEILKDIEPIEFMEATFIETPLILNNHDILNKTQSGLNITKKSSRRIGIPYTTLHTKDLFDKLKSTEWFFKNGFEYNIQNIINGEIIYDIDDKDFVYVRDEQKIPIKNTATGIKAFGIIQLLMDNGFINRTSLIIIDEPEIHIHPKWQLKYAQLISILVKNDIPLIITSHSPYMIEALKRYSDIESLESKTNFYLAQNGIIEDNEDSLSNIFKVLSEPFELFRKMDSEILEDE